MLLQFIILFLVIIFIILFIALFIRLTFPIQNDEKSYSIVKSGNGKNMNMCPKGCSRGSCKISRSENEEDDDNHCKFNFQCNYCQDEVTNRFYVNPDMQNEKEILPIYEESKNLVLSQKDLLNEAIQKNNDYIIDLNKRIVNMNS